MASADSWNLQGGHRPRPFGWGDEYASGQRASGRHSQCFERVLRARDSEYWQTEVRRAAIEFIARGIRGSIGSSACIPLDAARAWERSPAVVRIAVRLASDRIRTLSAQTIERVEA